MTAVHPKNRFLFTGTLYFVIGTEYVVAIIIMK
jgi:hypothetical protein